LTNQVILITGTPRVGKTSVAQKLAKELKAEYVNLTELALKEKLTLGRDEQRDTMIIDEERMKKRLSEIISKSKAEKIIIDSHYAVNVVPQQTISIVFVLRRDPVELRKIMEQSGFSEAKAFENLASEILDVCLVDALNIAGERKVCEIDTTGKTVEDTVQEMLSLLKTPTNCQVGIVDWLGKLEKDGVLDDYLKT